MRVRLRFLFLLLVAVAVSLPALAFNPKIRPYISDCDNAGAGNNEGSDVRLPVGIPFQYTDNNTGGGGENPGSHPARIVYSFDLTEDIGPASLRQTHDALEQARAMNVACVLIRINSYSGAIDAAQQIRDELLAFDRPIIIYIEDKAISAAALISMAGDSLYMRKGSNISDVKPAKKHAPAVEKAIAHRVETAKKETEKPAPAEKESSVAPGVMNSAEAVRQHLADAETSDLSEVLSRAGLKEYAVVYYSPGFFEQLIDLLMRPFASLLLVVLIAFGLRLQRSLPFPGPATFLLLIVLALFSIPMYEGGLANGPELLLLLPPIIFTIAGPLKRHSRRLLRYLSPFVLVLLLSLCQAGSPATVPLSGLLVTALLTGAAFLLGWTLPPLTTRLARRARLPLVRRAVTAA